jgi:hypothetical protein
MDKILFSKERNTMRPVLILFGALFQSIGLMAAPCLVDSQLCRKRSNFIYELDKLSVSLFKACGKEPKFEMDWNSFTKTLGGSDRYSADPCLKPLEFFVEFCETDKIKASSIFKMIDRFECHNADIDKQKIEFKNKRLVFAADPTNDYRSDRNGPSVMDYVRSELKKEFKINVASSSDASLAEDQARKKQEQQREQKAAELQKKRDDDVKNQVEAANNKAKIKFEKYQKETKRLTDWFQKEMQEVQKSNLSAEAKSKKMQSASEKYQGDLQKAVKEYGDGQ